MTTLKKNDIPQVLSFKASDPTPLQVVESAQKVILNRPKLDLNLSGNPALAWEVPSKTVQSHSTDLIHRTNVMLFGQNHLVDLEGKWSCESRRLPDQFLRFYAAPFYDHFHPGHKPRVKISADGAAHYLEINDADREALIELDEPIFLMTPLEPDNWGRWILLSLMKMRCLKELDICADSKPFSRYKHEWQKNLFRFMSIQPGEVKIHDPGSTYLCRSVYTLNYSSSDFIPSSKERDLFEEISCRCGDAGRTLPERIYVSRQNQSRKSPHYRVLQNEDKLIAELSAKGYAIIEPEMLSFDEQVRIFRHAKIVVGLGGTGMFNTIFCCPGTTVIDIESSSTFVADHARLFAAMGLDYSVIFGEQDLNDLTPVHKRWYLDINRVMKAVECLT